MRWRRTDAVQQVDALLLTGTDAARRMRAALGRRLELYGALTLAAGVDWAAVFAAPMAGESEMVLPRVAGAMALYRVHVAWWFPVGTALAVPDPVQGALLDALAERQGVAGRIIAVPRFTADRSGEVDLYHARDAVRVGDLAGPTPHA